MQLKYSQNLPINILFDKVVCTFGPVPDLHHSSKHRNAFTVRRHIHEWKSACVRADSGYRCSIIQSISLGFKALTEN